MTVLPAASLPMMSPCSSGSNLTLGTLVWRRR
jgi:hypothetical protein